MTIPELTKYKLKDIAEDFKHGEINLAEVFSRVYKLGYDDSSNEFKSQLKEMVKNHKFY